jgi:hypothetical protein
MQRTKENIQRIREKKQRENNRNIDVKGLGI